MDAVPGQREKVITRTQKEQLTGEEAVASSRGEQRN